MNAIKKTVVCAFLLAVFACEKENTPELVCNCEDPIKELDWLNAKFKQFHGGAEINGIVLYSYQNKEVIEVQNLVFSSTNQHQFHCDGVKLNLDSAQAYQAYLQNRKQIKILYGTNVWDDWE